MGASGDSDFLRACDEGHPKMFALVRKLNEHHEHELGRMFLVRVFDTKSNTWLALQSCSGLPEAGWGGGNLRARWRGMKCKDGGLMLISLEAHRIRKCTTIFLLLLYGDESIDKICT